MPLQPEDWNVVVAGRWNPALFTPAAVSQRIFGLPDATPVEVFVSVDDIVPPRVRYNGITVSASPASMIVGVERSTYAELDRARQTATDAIAALPHTPVSAAGFNIRYRADGLPVPIAGRFSADLDRRFSDLDFEIVGRQFHRLLTFRSGRLLVRVTSSPDEKPEVLLNFTRSSKSEGDLREWLAVPSEEIQRAVSRVLREALELREDDYVGEQQ
jgi:hypothetical protein